jgi:hypothetical protein
VIGPLALELLRAYDPPRPVRLLGVRVASFEHEEEAEGRPATADGPEAEDGEGEAEPQLRLSLPS